MEYSSHGLSSYHLGWNERLSALFGYVVSFSWAGRSLHGLLIPSDIDFTWSMLFEEPQIRDDDGRIKLTSDTPFWLSEEEGDEIFWESDDDDWMLELELTSDTFGSVDYEQRRSSDWYDNELITFNSISSSFVRGFFVNEWKKIQLFYVFQAAFQRILFYFILFFSVAINNQSIENKKRS